MFGGERKEDHGLRHKYFGKYAGRVLQNGPPEGAKHRGELLVEVPGILEEKPDGSGERALQVLAKPCFLPGSFFIPALEAQVWVEFVAGEIDHPIWTGVWYPVDAAPPTSDDLAPTEFQTVLRTPGGHVIQLDDTEGEEKLVIHHRSKSVLTIDKDGNITILHKDGAKAELKGEKKVELFGEEITLDGKVQVTGTLTVGTGPKTTIDGNEIKGG